MAVKITVDGYLNVEHPHNERYTIKGVANSLETDEDSIKFADMGTFIIATDMSKERELNSVGSLYFRFAVFGNILIMSARELPEGSPIATAENGKYDIPELEAGIIKSIKNALYLYKQVMNDDVDAQEEFEKVSNKLKEKIKSTKSEKTVYQFDPDKEGDIDDNEAEFITTFYTRAFDAIKDRKRIDINKLVLFEDSDVVIKFMPGKVKKTLSDMMTYFSELEDYEKCAVIRDITKKIKDVSQEEINNAVQE
ncbi:MAG: hypothetical protein WC979_01340 [Candidatus Pacearchaeota archaeon]|jgi:hypothetical protein|nr:hypothetical protein [Clostridia bacterium]